MSDLCLFHFSWEKHCNYTEMTWDEKLTFVALLGCLRKTWPLFLYCSWRAACMQIYLVHNYIAILAFWWKSKNDGLRFCLTCLDEKLKSGSWSWTFPKLGMEDEPLGAMDENLTFLVNWTITLKPEHWTNKLTQTLNHHLNPKTNSSKSSVYQGLTKW